MSEQFNLAWGHSPAVRKAFLDTYNGKKIDFNYKELMSMDYPDHAGDPTLIELTRDVIRRQIGREYKYILLTNGATGAIDIALRAYKAAGYQVVVTRDAPWYSRYPGQIQAAGLIHNPPYHGKKVVVLNDLPSNPLGSAISMDINGRSSILDAVYLNGVFSHIKIPVPEHEVLIGSYSKLLGLNGIRIGWIATNTDLLFERLRELVTVEYCGLSSASTIILNRVLVDLDWDKFESKGRLYLDNNRTEWSKLQKFFHDPVNPIGMFHYTGLDASAWKLLNKSGIIWTKGSTVGTNDSFARFNLGIDNAIAQKVVHNVLKLDTLK